MKSSDLRSNQVRLLIYTLTLISAIGFLVPITATFIDEQITIDLIGINQSASIGLGVIMVATSGGILGAFVIKRRFMFIYYKNCYCKKTGEQMYESDNHEQFFCPSHGEQQMEWQTPDDRHYEYLTKDEREQSIQAKAIGKKYNESQKEMRTSDYFPKSTSIHQKTSFMENVLNGKEQYHSHTHGFGRTVGGGSSSGKKLTKQDLENKIGTLNEKLSKLDKQLTNDKSKKRIAKITKDDDDDDLLGLGLGLSL